MSRRPLRRYQDVDRVNASSRRQAGAEREPVAAALPAVELKPVDLRPTLPLPPICNLPRSSGADREDSLKRVSSVSEHYKPLESGEGIGSYASKVAAAGLGPLPNPRLVVEYHPLVAKARMDRNVAAGYDPNVEWGSESILAGQNIADLGDDADEEEEELELRGGSREERPSSSATVDDVDLPEFGFEESDEVDWGADFVDDEEETLQDEFGRVLDETIEQRLGEDPAEEDTEGFGVWDGTDEEDGLGDSRGSTEGP
ncbi:hypothetical protein WJX75_006539 [Coccomyxa subellipsoidea]|uniref:CCD97-like C-terminal domain-containing protein n=1 Tax=Coccomyxa subellipsoidea TaxID=248742 RepID=A0ABR2Z490_9CHLO